MNWIQVVYFKLKQKPKKELIFYVINVPVLYPYVPVVALMQQPISQELSCVES